MAVAKQRGKGEGSIYFEAATGRWRGAVVLPDGTRRRVSGRTKKDCRARLRAVQLEVERGLPIGPGRLTVEDFLTRWSEDVLPARARVRSTNTTDNYRRVMRTHLIPALGPKLLWSLTPDDVERLLRSMARAGRARSTINRVRAVLVLALTHAERRGLVVRNAARLAEMPAGIRPTAEGRSLTADEARVLLDTARGDRLEALLVTGLMLGLRPGELGGLLWEDVDLEATTLQVRRSLKWASGAWRLGDPKTRRSFRALDLPAPVVEALRAHRVRQVEDRLRAGRAWMDLGFVFASAIGTPLDAANLRRSFANLTRRAGLGHWTPKELRHSAASLLCAAGVPLEHVADVLGHDGTRMTGGVYRHAVRPTVAAAVAPMERLFGG